MELPEPTPTSELAPTLARLRGAWDARRPDATQRRTDLQRLEAVFAARIDAMDAAIRADFGHRSTHENLVSEAMIVRAEIAHALRHLRGWMRPRRVGVGWRFWPARAEVRPMPIGVVGIIAPWNYPVNLALVPLVSAIAAGNHVYLKPSEYTPRTSAWLRQLLADVFPDDRVAVALGGADVGAAFSALPFDHLLFTGSTAIGRRVLAAAAPNLTPVTLELGGKSPAIVAPDFPVDLAAARSHRASGSTPARPASASDYVLVDAPRRDALVAALRTRTARALRRPVARRRLHPRSSTTPNSRGCRAPSTMHACAARCCDNPSRSMRRRRNANACFRRRWCSTAGRRSADARGDLRPDAADPRLRRHRRGDRLRQHARAAAGAVPLQHFTRAVERILAGTLAGGVSVNDTLLHFGVHGLPFGGVGPSGMGAIHGRAGFETFSKLLPVFRQSRFAASDWIKPPYRGVVDRLVRLLAR